MEVKYKFWILLIVAITLGVFIGWVDSSPKWDDSGITSMMLFGSATLLGFAMPKRIWVWALAIGIWVPIWNILLHSNYESFIALLFTSFGAYIGGLIHKVLLK